MGSTRVAVVQFGTTLDKRANIDKALSKLDELERTSGDGFDLVCLPELFTLRALSEPSLEEFNDFVEPEGGSLQGELAKRAASLGAYVVAGSFLQRGNDGRVYNQSLVFDRSGRVIDRYRKTHLFDAPGHSESDRVAPGDGLLAFETDFGIVGVVICYELRFPEVARTLALAGASILAVPNSWPVDGVNLAADQLRVLLRGTALQNLCYVVHANQYGRVAGLDLCGRSCVIDPKGEIVAQASDMEQTITTRIDPSFVRTMRAVRTTFRHRRPELYREEAVTVARPGSET